MSNIKDTYLCIMLSELDLNPVSQPYRDAVINADLIDNIAHRVIEVARNSIVLRCCAKYGHITNDEIAYESDGAHTNLVSAIADYAMDFIYTLCGRPLPYPHRDIIEAIRVHDLPENIFGDQPDNEDMDRAEKLRQEARYWDKLFRMYPIQQALLVKNVKKILNEMECHSTDIGRIVYLSDKIAAIIATLCYDDLEVFSASFMDDANVSGAGREAMEICDEQALCGFQKQSDGTTVFKPQYLCSELWTIDYFVGRKLNSYDTTGFFTALLVMITLILKGNWYNWRYQEYWRDVNEQTPLDADVSHDVIS